MDRGSLDLAAADAVRGLAMEADVTTVRRGATIAVKRAYEPASRADGKRFLVDRLWPRGITKSALVMDAWVKDVAPSTALRKWSGHDPAKWTEFRRRYFRELDDNRAALAPLLEAARHGTVTLVYGARDEEHNNAVALCEYLERLLG